MEHSDYSVNGSEFVDFLSETLTYRILSTFKAKGLLKEQTYSKIKKALKKLELLDDDTQAPKKRRGKPRKNAL